MTTILQIIFVGDALTITKKDGTQCYKQTLTLRELGGKYDNQFVATYFCPKPIDPPLGIVIAGSLSFRVRNHDGIDYQDIILQEFQPLQVAPLMDSHPFNP